MAESPPACPLPGPGQEPGRTSQTLSSALRALGALKTSASLSLRLSFQWSPPFPTLHSPFSLFVGAPDAPWNLV